jgi:hypothetical protein
MPWIQRRAIVNVQMPGEDAVRCRIDAYQHSNRGRTLQGLWTTITCTQLGTHTPTGSGSQVVTPASPAWQAKLLSIAPNAGATYRSDADTAPTNPFLGDLWYQTDTQLWKRYDGSDWQNTGASPLEASSTAGTAFATKTGKVKIYDDGSFEFGNYNSTTKAGGIGYNVTADKLYGNVAYDQWDLVIESDADLAKLCTGETTYKNVLVAPGTWTTEAQIDLDAHGVEIFVGINKSNCIIDLDYEGSATTAMIKCGTEITEIGNLTITSSTTQTAAVYAIYIPSATTAKVHDIKSTGFDDLGTCIYNAGGVNGFVTVENCEISDYNNAIFGGRCSNCSVTDCAIGYFSCTAVNCTAKTCDNGFLSCVRVGQCQAEECDSSFESCSYVAGCLSNKGATYGFRLCNYMSACYAFTNLSSGTGFSSCTYVSSARANGHTTGWSGGSYIDAGSTNV